MDKTDRYRELEKGFLSTFLAELMPGVLHNFANPLNGIMGRAKLLQRRLADSMRKFEELHPGFAKEFDEERISRDVNSISTEAERFFTIFRDLAAKVSTLASAEPERINLSRLIEQEVRFADFYLDFKHDIKKQLHLDENLPGVLGNAADYSLCLTALINSARERLKKRPEKELSFFTSHDAGQVYLIVGDNGEAISDACQKAVENDEQALADPLLGEMERVLGHALLLLRQCGASVRVEAAAGENRIFLVIPYEKW